MPKTQGAFTVVYGDHYVWVGTSSGVVRLDPSTLAYTNFDELDRAPYILPIEDDQVFAVSDRGIFYFDGQVWYRPEFAAPYFLDAQHMIEMGLTTDGDLLWFEQGAVLGTMRGLRFKGHVPPRNGPWHAAEDHRMENYAPLDCARNRMLVGAYRTSEECRRYITARQQLEQLKQPVGLAAADADGTFWVFDGNGHLMNLTRDGSTLSLLAVPREYGRPMSYTADPIHGVWLAGTDGLFKADGTSVRRIPIGLEEYTLYPPGGIAVDTRGSVWVSTERGLQHLSADGREWHFADDREQRFADGVDLFGPLSGVYSSLQLEAAHDGGLWLLPPSDLLHYDGRTLKTVPPPPAIVPPRPADQICALSSLAVDSSGNVWVSDYDCGLLQFNPRSNEWQRHLPGEHISTFSIGMDDIVYALDSADQLWTYTSARATWQTVARLARTANHPIYRMVADNQGGVWIGANESGELWQYQPGWIAPQIQCKLKDDYFFLFNDRQDRLWISTPNELMRFGGRNWQTIATPPIGWIGAMTAAPDGRLWFAGPQGVAVYDPSRDATP